MAKNKDISPHDDEKLERRATQNFRVKGSLGHDDVRLARLVFRRAIWSKINRIRLHF